MAARHKRRGDQAARQARARRVADVLRLYEASPFQFEAACVHGLRAALCLQGWGWQQAHHEARQTVLSGLDLIGARRPSWDMGQIGYALHEYGGFTERTRCAWCHGPMPADRPKYCGDSCNGAAKSARNRRHRNADLATKSEVADREIERTRRLRAEPCAA